MRTVCCHNYENVVSCYEAIFYVNYVIEWFIEYNDHNLTMYALV